ncbi:MAG: 4-hydroxy-tetrahydrodipicolinate synthase [Actinomycetota bacterium]|jgi:4-hydroxy-tetrahydrodipicolinate synthase|nr:4-hydroxy-tetrahydrodipicolinate synthase [Actinomycetota bacterium]
MTAHDHRARFGSVVTAMVTPFDAQGVLDLDAAAVLARWLAGHGSDGLVVAGTTGEGMVLTDPEKADLWRAVAEAVTVPVIAGAGTNDTQHSIELAKRAAGTGVDGILVVTPYYSRPSQQGLYEHFTAVAGATSLPVMLYDIPIRSGRRIDTSTFVRVSEAASNVVAVKDATGDPAGAARTVAAMPSSFEVYCGDDSLTLPLMAVGAVGVVSVAAHWAGVEMREMISAFAAGDVARAAHINRRLIESYTFESSEEFPNPLPAKAACRVQGLDVGQCRLPMGSAPPELDGEARRIITRLSTPSTAGNLGA